MTPSIAARNAWATSASRWFMPFGVCRWYCRIPRCGSAIWASFTGGEWARTRERARSYRTSLQCSVGPDLAENGSELMSGERVDLRDHRCLAVGIVRVPDGGNSSALLGNLTIDSPAQARGEVCAGIHRPFAAGGGEGAANIFFPAPFDKR